jgi:uncharacterized membrane protein
MEITMNLLIGRSNPLLLTLLGLGVLAHYLLTSAPYVADALFFLGVIIHSTKIWGLARTLIYIITAMCLGYLAEFIGINTGLVFGVYHYNTTNPGMIFGVPYFIPIQYAYLLYAGNMVCIAICGELMRRHHVWMLAILTGVILTLKDLSTDPIKSTVEQIWIWNNGGAYFGEPVHNFVGWFFLFATLTLAATTLAWHRGNMSANVKLSRETFYFPLLLLSAVVIFSISLALSVPDSFSGLGSVSLLVILLGTTPYLLLGWFNVRNGDSQV